jgi:mono/diheme cytochrome c family protein
MAKQIIRYTFFLLFLAPVFVNAQTKQPVTATPAVLKASINRGKGVYMVNCLTCHQVDGAGVPNLNPPLFENKWVTGPKATIIRMVMKGSKGTVEIDGDTFNNTMPVQAHLTDQQIADALTYVRNSFGNKASAVTPAEVKAVRLKK